MKDKKIVIPARVLQHLRPGQIGMVKLTPAAYNALVDLANESGMTLTNLASEIIIQATEKDLIQFNRSYKEDNE